MRVIFYLDFAGKQDRIGMTGATIEEAIFNLVEAIRKKHAEIEQAKLEPANKTQMSLLKQVEDFISGANIKAETNDIEEFLLLAHDMGKLIYKHEGTHWADEIYSMTMLRTEKVPTDYTLYTNPVDIIEEGLSSLMYKHRREGLCVAINNALDNKDKARFTALAIELSELDEQYKGTKVLVGS